MDLRERTGTVLWWVLRTHKLSEEFLRHGVKGHPSIVPIVNDHLLETAVSKAQVSMLAHQVEANTLAIKRLGYDDGDEVAGAEAGARRRAKKKKLEVVAAVEHA